ncbi:hypothetical protein AAMO2058_001383900 [Amorphochlora amoebiformis]
MLLHVEYTYIKSPSMVVETRSLMLFIVGGGSLEDQLLAAAGRDGKLDEVIRLLNLKANTEHKNPRLSPNSTNRRGETPMMAAACYARISILQYLLSNSAKVNTQDLHHRTPLIYAVKSRDLDTVRFLALEAKAKPNFGFDRPAQDKLSALSIAAKNGDLAIVKILVEGCQAIVNFNKNINTLRKQTTLMHALKAALGRRTSGSGEADSDSLSVVRYLVSDAKARVNDKDAFGNTALMVAIGDRSEKDTNYRSSLQAVRFLVETGGANILAVDKSGKTALGRAALFDQVAIVDYLAGKSRPEDRFSSLMLIAARNLWTTDAQVKIASLLIDKFGVRVDRATRDGITPLMAAAYSNHPRLVQLLTSRKAKVNLQSNNLLGRHSALALAVAREHEDVVKLLLDAKADTQAQVVIRGRRLSLPTKEISRMTGVHSKKNEKLKSRMSVVEWAGKVCGRMASGMNVFGMVFQAAMANSLRRDLSELELLHQSISLAVGDASAGRRLGTYGKNWASQMDDHLEKLGRMMTVVVFSRETMGCRG